MSEYSIAAAENTVPLYSIAAPERSGNNPSFIRDFRSENSGCQGHILAVTVLVVPNSLDRCKDTTLWGHFSRIMSHLYHETLVARNVAFEKSTGDLAWMEREFFIDNLLVQIHFIIVIIRCTGLAMGIKIAFFK